MTNTKKKVTGFICALFVAAGGFFALTPTSTASTQACDATAEACPLGCEMGPIGCECW